MTAARRAGDSCDHGVLNVPGLGASEVWTLARYGSIWVLGSPDCCSIHSRAALQAWKYSSSVDSASASTEVVTPPGETPEPAAAEVPVGVVGDDAGPPSVPEEQPTRITKHAVAKIAATVVARWGCPRMQSIYATRFAVLVTFNVCAAQGILIRPCRVPTPALPRRLGGSQRYPRHAGKCRWAA